MDSIRGDQAANRARTQYGASTGAETEVKRKEGDVQMSDFVVTTTHSYSVDLARRSGSACAAAIVQVLLHQESAKKEEIQKNTGLSDAEYSLGLRVLKKHNLIMIDENGKMIRLRRDIPKDIHGQSLQAAEKRPARKTSYAKAKETPQFKDAQLLADLYAKHVKAASFDASRTRGIVHLVRMLSEGIDKEEIRRAIENYAEACVRLRTPAQYRLNIGNFFGRDEPWREFADKSWTPPPRIIEIEDKAWRSEEPKLPGRRIWNLPPER